MRENILAVLLAVASALIVAGVAIISAPGAFITAGVLVAGMAWLFFGEVPE